MPLNTLILGTAIATNALFVNLAQDATREIRRWRLPIPLPLEPAALNRFSSVEGGDCTLRLKSGWRLSFWYGRLTAFASPASDRVRRRAEPGDRVAVTLHQALEIASNYVARAQLPATQTWVHLRPQVEEPRLPLSPFYELTWYRPDEENTVTVDIAVDCRDGSVAKMGLWCLLGRLPSEHKTGKPRVETSEPPPREVEARMVKSMADEVRKWGATLGIPGGLVQQPASQRLVDWLKDGKDAAGEHWLAKVHAAGWELSFADGKLCGWKAPDAFFDSETPPDLERAAGRWRLSQAKAVALVRKYVAQVGLPRDRLGTALRQPEVYKPKLFGPPTVPRFLFRWLEERSDAHGRPYLNSMIEAEVDADQGRVTSLSIYLWREGTSRFY
jgi:hypothetical protein